MHMHNIYTQLRSPHAITIQNLSLKAQILINKASELGLLKQVKELKIIDSNLEWLLIQHKATGGSTHYIWHTQGDGKVRADHAANNGKIFAWDNPPETGNPGEDYNCRCWAEPYKEGKTEYVQQDLSYSMPDSQKWDTSDFLKHFYFGGSRLVTLPETGHLSGIIDYYFYHIYKDGAHTYDRINKQIIKSARNHSEGDLHHYFDNSYTEFENYFWVFGGGTVKGQFNGTLRKEGRMMYIKGNITTGTSEPLDTNILNILATDALGHYFDIVGTWKTTFHAEIVINPENSAH